jgi:hypothetical protein
VVLTVGWPPVSDSLWPWIAALNLVPDCRPEDWCGDIFNAAMRDPTTNIPSGLIYENCTQFVRKYHKDLTLWALVKRHPTPRSGVQYHVDPYDTAPIEKYYYSWHFK